MRHFLLLLGLVCFGNSYSHSAATISVVESGGDVVATASGMLDTSSFGAPVSQSFTSGYVVGPGTLVVGTGLGFIHSYSLGSDSTSFSTGGLFNSSSSSGDAVGISVVGGTATLLVPLNYVSNSSVSGSSTYSGQSFATMGLQPGQYVFNWGSGAAADSLTLTIGSSSTTTTTTTTTTTSTSTTTTTSGSTTTTTSVPSATRPIPALGAFGIPLLAVVMAVIGLLGFSRRR